MHKRIWRLQWVLAARSAAVVLLMLCSVAAVAAVAAGRSPSMTQRIAAQAQPLDVDTAAGLDPLGTAVGDARVVLLGEPWHGDGGAIALRTALVRYLHEHKGFDVLVFEADFYALARGWEDVQAGADARRMARENVYPFWSAVPAAAPLWTYIEAQARGGRPLIVAGMDTKVTGALSRTRLVDELTTRFAQLPGVDAAMATRAMGAYAALLDPAKHGAPGDADVALLMKLSKQWRASPDVPSSFDHQLAVSFDRMLAGERRDTGMADNLLWLVRQRYPDKKLIVWLHNNHALADRRVYLESPDPRLRAQMAVKDFDAASTTYVGDLLRRDLGQQVFVVGLLSGAGEYSADIAPALSGQPADFGRTAMLPRAPSGTLEAALHARGLRTGFVDLRPFRGQSGAVRSRVLDYTQMPALSLRLWDGYDALLYLDRTHGLMQP